MLSQKEAVYQATMAVLQQSGIELEEGQNIREAMGDNLKLRGQIRDLVFEALRNGQVSLGGGDRDDRSIRTYATGLISNWFRKDKRLNGGTRYRPTTTREDQNVGSSYDYKVAVLQQAAEIADDDDLRKRIEEQIADIREQQSLERRLDNDIKAGHNKGDFDDDDDNGDDNGNKQQDAYDQEHDQDDLPSVGSGHKGAVTDPEHDMRLKQNQTPELLKARQEAGHKGGTAVRNERGSEFFSKIGQKGGLSRRSDDDQSDMSELTQSKEGNIFLRMLKGRAS